VITVGTVRLTRALYARFRLLAYELGKFGVVGAAAFAVTDAGTNLLHFRAGLGPLISNVIATVMAMAVSYAGNRYWTFRYRQRSGVRREGVLFLLLNGVGLVIQLACLVIGIGLATLFRYWSYRTWVWRAQPPAPAVTRSPAPSLR
jgi:putative flippase GtrA